MVLLDSGDVATGSACCCGESTCCVFGYAPFFNSDDSQYYSGRTDNCCTLTGTYSGLTDNSHRFFNFDSEESACGGGYTGSISFTKSIDPVTCIETVNCSGQINDSMGHCIEGDAPGCDHPCGHTGCFPNTVNVQTLSNPCNLPTGACCVAGVCTEETSSQCSDDGGFYYGNGTTCPQADCAVGACCFFGSCFEGIVASVCISGGGTFVGAGTTCDPFPC